MTIVVVVPASLPIKIKKRMRNPSSKCPKTPTDYHSRGFGTQWAVGGSNP